MKQERKKQLRKKVTRRHNFCTNFYINISEILEAKTERGVALQDILRDVHTLVTHIKFSDTILIAIYSKLGEIEQRYELYYSYSYSYSLY